jgi:hypothetical protein
VQYRRCYSIDISWIRLIAFIMLPLRKFTESEAQVREMAEDLILEPFPASAQAQSWSRISWPASLPAATRTFFPDTESRAQIATGGDSHDMLAHSKDPRVRKFLTRRQEGGDSVGSHG